MRIRMLAALAAAPLVLGGLSAPAVAEVNPVTLSTNDANLTNGWAHFTATALPGAVELTFVTTRDFDSCFEYRADGEPPQDGVANPNPEVTDGLWEYVCVNAAGTDATDGTDTETIQVRAEEEVEVRLVFGAERDERFDWTSVTPGAVVVPSTAQECKKGGYAALGFTNQGRCVSAVKRAERDARKAAKVQQRTTAKAAKTAQAGAKSKG